MWPQEGGSGTEIPREVPLDQLSHWEKCFLSISESRALGLWEQTGGKSHSSVTPLRGCPLGMVVGGREIQAHVFSLMVG